MYPDLGVVLFERSMDKPFRLTVFDGLTLAQDRVLGWMINGQTRKYLHRSNPTSQSPNNHRAKSCLASI